MLNLWINVYLTLKMCCSFSWHNKQSVCAGWDMARLAKFFAFQTENPKFREGYEKTLCHWLGYCFGLASHWCFFFFFFGGHEPRLQWYQLVSGVGERPVLWRHERSNQQHLNIDLLSTGGQVCGTAEQEQWIHYYMKEMQLSVSPSGITAFWCLS